MLDYEAFKCYDCLMAYNWQQPDWPNFTYELDELGDLLIEVKEKLAWLDGLYQGLPEESRFESDIEQMVVEALKTSAIEGEFMSRADVMSSIRNNLGLSEKPLHVADARAEGIGKLMVEIRRTYEQVLTEELLFDWHRMLLWFEKNKQVGAWRTHAEPMQILSGTMDKPKIEFEAPPSNDVPDEMARFIDWFNEPASHSEDLKKHPALLAAVSHIYFETIHPFEDGNGRMGRAISEKALSQGLGRPISLSLSKTIEANTRRYYESLKAAQRSNEITDWIRYFLQVILQAQSDARAMIEFTIKKSKLFTKHENDLNARQLKVIRRILAEGPDGFEGGMSTKKYMSITKTSRATATRDLQRLVVEGILKPKGGGHSTHYELILE